jgi:hypothetical protein
LAYPYLGGLTPSAVASPNEDPTTSAIKRKALVAANNSGLGGVSAATQTQSVAQAALPTTPSADPATVDLHVDFNNMNQYQQANVFNWNPGADHNGAKLQQDVNQTSKDYNKALADGILDPTTAAEINADFSNYQFEGADAEIQAAEGGKGVYGVRQLNYKQRQIAALQPGRAQLSTRIGSVAASGSSVSLVS